MALSRSSGLKYSLLFPLLLVFLLASVFVVQAERPFPKPEGLVNDFAGVIPPAYKQKIAALTGVLLKETGIPIVVVTMPDIGGAEYNDYANRLYSAWGIGKKGEDKGVLICRGGQRAENAHRDRVRCGGYPPRRSGGGDTGSLHDSVP